VAATLADQRKPELVARLAYGRTYSALGRALADLREKGEAFAAAAGERESVNQLQLSLQLIEEKSRRIPSGRISAATLMAASMWLDELRTTVFRSEIVEDIRLEADESDSAHAHDLHASLQHALRQHDSHRESLTELAEHHSLEERNMADTDSIAADSRPNPARPTVRVITSTASADNAVMRQLKATLDGLGLPHTDGLLDLRSGNSATLASRLIDALDRRFDIQSDPVEGMRATVRRMSLSGPEPGRSADLTGRMAVAAEAAVACAKQLRQVIEDVDDLLSRQEDWTIADPDRVERRREAFAAEIGKVVDLAQRPGGPPKSHSDFYLKSLGRKLLQYVAALGIYDGDVACPDKQLPAKSEFEDAAGAALGDIPEERAEEVRNLLERARKWFNDLKDQLTESAGDLLDSEAAYHLNRILLATPALIDTLQQSIEDSPAAAAWIAVPMQEPNEDDRFLASDLDGTLELLGELAAEYGTSDTAFDAMTPVAMGELQDALEDIRVNLGECVAKIPDIGVLVDDELTARLTTLQQLVETAAGLAGRLRSAL